jgi:hypothetical protein
VIDSKGECKLRIEGEEMVLVDDRGYVVANIVKTDITKGTSGQPFKVRVTFEGIQVGGRMAPVDPRQARMDDYLATAPTEPAPVEEVVVEEPAPFPVRSEATDQETDPAQGRLHEPDDWVAVIPDSPLHPDERVVRVKFPWQGKVHLLEAFVTLPPGARMAPKVETFGPDDEPRLIVDVQHASEAA